MLSGECRVFPFSHAVSQEASWFLFKNLFFHRREIATRHDLCTKKRDRRNSRKKHKMPRSLIDVTHHTTCCWMHFVHAIRFSARERETRKERRRLNSWLRSGKFYAMSIFEQWEQASRAFLQPAQHVALSAGIGSGILRICFVNWLHLPRDNRRINSKVCHNVPQLFYCKPQIFADDASHLQL